MSETHPKVDAFLAGAETWQEEMRALRRIALDAGLKEEFKWRLPCYTHEGSNVAIIQNFKEQCALMFFKGVLLKDPAGLLEKPGENSRIGRRMVFTGVDDILDAEEALRGFIEQAVQFEKEGRKIEVERKPEERPDELVEMFEEHPELKEAFEALTPGRRRGYILHFSSAKQSSTRRSRIEKVIPKILEGKGLRD